MAEKVEKENWKCGFLGYILQSLLWRARTLLQEERSRCDPHHVQRKHLQGKIGITLVLDRKFLAQGLTFLEILKCKQKHAVSKSLFPGITF